MEELKSILMSEISQPEKATYYVIPTISHSVKDKILEIVKRSGVMRGVGDE